MRKTEFNKLRDKITKAITEAVHNAIQDHLQRGNPVYVMKEGKMVILRPPKRQKANKSGAIH